MCKLPEHKIKIIELLEKGRIEIQYNKKSLSKSRILLHEIFDFINFHIFYLLFFLI